MAVFRLCSTCQSRSQAGFCHCTQRPISDRSEPTFARRRYALGGDRPQSNYPPRMVPDPDNGPRLDIKQNKGGISREAPPKLAFRLQSLPHILHMIVLMPGDVASKGAQGLSVLLRVPGIFTESAISLSPWWRQWGDRYTIRAGRNLPDKEFRYLRTVIVTAAVYLGFNSELSPLLFNLRAPNRRQTLYVILRLRRAMCF